jgi:hypothetical protein
MADEPRPPGPSGRRRGAKGPGSRWIPGRQKGPFLPGLPQHSETGVMAKIDPEFKRRRRLARRTFVALLIRWRYVVTFTLLLSFLAGAVGLGMVLLRDVNIDKDKLPTQAAPTLEELNRSIALGENYVKALYKPLPGEMAVQSEASGVPLKVHFPTDDTWVLLGEEKEACPNDGNDCEPTTLLDPVSTGNEDEKYDVTFSTNKTRGAFKATVSIKWNFKPDQFQITLLPKNVSEPVEIWLDNKQLTDFSPTKKEESSHAIPTSQQALMRMLRFTIRHATQEAYMYWLTYGDDPKRAAALASFLERNRYTPGYDMRAPLFGQSGELPDDLPFRADAYPDCDHVAESSEFAYAYRSKVCLFRDTYLNVGARDPFLQAWQALTTLEKYKDPDRKLPNGGWWLQGETPAEIAHHLQGQWNRTGYGVPKCTPFSCNEMSGIRTSVFGALQAELGYRYGNASSRKFADAAAKMIVTAQVGTDGKIRMADGTYYRPSQVGAYLAAWDTADTRFIVPSAPKLVAGIAYFVTGEEPIPPEYLGIVPSNSETSFDALGFLHLYRCEKYKVC